MEIVMLIFKFVMQDDQDMAALTTLIVEQYRL